MRSPRGPTRTAARWAYDVSARTLAEGGQYSLRETRTRSDFTGTRISCCLSRTDLISWGRTAGRRHDEEVSSFAHGRTRGAWPRSHRDPRAAARLLDRDRASRAQSAVGA